MSSAGGDSDSVCVWRVGRSARAGKGQEVFVDEGSLSGAVRGGEVGCGMAVVEGSCLL